MKIAANTQLTKEIQDSLNFWLKVYNAPKLSFSKKDPNAKKIIKDNIFSFQLRLLSGISEKKDLRLAE
jgi:hypothetical protein